MSPDAFEVIAGDLRGDRAPRVWSLLVTVFGDLAQDGSGIGTPVLGRICSQIGIKPEAMRVALHRLRKDGWLTSERQGRVGLYRLSAEGRRESIAASPRIYATEPLAGAAWLVFEDPLAAVLPTGGAGVWLTQGVTLTSAPPENKSVLVTPIDPFRALPEWMRAKTCGADVIRWAEDLEPRLDRLVDLLERVTLPEEPNPVQVAALRVLIVHEWRRIVLRLPRLPDYVFPEQWAGPACRSHVGRLLELLPRPGLDQLQMDALG